jgi:hypothetical protein
MNIIAKVRKIETIMARTFNDAAQRVAPVGAREPLEVLHAILDAVENEVQPAGRGSHVFPFNRLKISVLASSRETRARLEALFDEAPTLHERIVERLRGADCDATDLTAKVAYVSEAAEGWMDPQFHVEFARGARVTPIESPATLQRRMDLAVVCGTADASTYSFAQSRVDMGRCVEVRDQRQRLIRTNHVAFADAGAGPNQSVSRCHAHLEYDDTSGDYRVYDDRSAHGTSVLRNGRALVVAAGSRGVRVQSGDEIVLGEARLRVTIDGDTRQAEPPNR